VLQRLRRIERGENPDSAAPAARPEPVAVRRVAPRPLSPGAVALAGRLRASGHEPPTRAQLGDDARHLEALRAAGVAVRIGRDMYAHADAIGEVRARVSAIIRAEGAITLARLRDELHTSRRFAQALLEHLDADRLTHRRPDNSRVLRRGRKTLSDLCTGFLTKRNLTIALQQHQRAERRW
jgi:selenocysteine-specific elongation factor